MRQTKSEQTPHEQDWRLVDEGWGRHAVEFSTLSEPSNCREYVALHQHLGVGRGVRLLDVACGAGLAIELAAARGASCAGIDASSRLLAVARDRNPGADLRVGDMQAMPWPDGAFDVVTSFRGIWGTTPLAVAEAHRVLAPGGRVGITVWGHIKASPGAWAFAPFRLASRPKVENQAAMVALGRPGAGEELLGRTGFVDVERVDIPCALEFADPEAYARALATTGPAFEAVQIVGERGFREAAVAAARERVRDGLSLRAVIAVVGYLGRKAWPVTARSGRGTASTKTASPNVASTSSAVTAESGPDGRDDGGPGAGFLPVPPASPEVQRLYDDDVAQMGFVMNASRLWAHSPSAHDALFALMGEAAKAASLTLRQRGILVAACASTLGDSYCSLAWGIKLAEEAGPELAAGVIRGDDDGLEAAERALARWARQVATDPNGTAAADVQPLRDGGYDDAQVLAITTYVALRIAFSTVNAALGARPDHDFRSVAPAPVRAAVTFGRPLDAAPD